MKRKVKVKVKVKVKRKVKVKVKVKVKRKVKGKVRGKVRGRDSGVRRSFLRIDLGAVVWMEDGRHNFGSENTAEFSGQFRLRERYVIDGGKENGREGFAGEFINF